MRVVLITLLLVALAFAGYNAIQKREALAAAEEKVRQLEEAAAQSASLVAQRESLLAQRDKILAERDAQIAQLQAQLGRPPTKEPAPPSWLDRHLAEDAAALNPPTHSRTSSVRPPANTSNAPGPGR